MAWTGWKAFSPACKPWGHWRAALALGAVMLSGCFTNAGRAPAIGEAFVGSVQLQLREDLVPRAKVVATLKYGDRIEVIAARRRFVKVRTADDQEGWTDARRLLTSEQMSSLNKLAQETKGLASQGRAKVFSTLNVHTEPYRLAPTFYQLQEEEPCDVLRLKANSRDASYEPPSLVREAKRARASEGKEDRSKTPTALLMPKAPEPPPNWVELSKMDAGDPEPVVPVVAAPAKGKGKKEEKAASAVDPRLEEWALIRLKDGRVGWALFNPLFMEVPDDVAQYAEGNRITSYFELGSYDDPKAGVKKDWLWTTLAGPSTEFDYDRVRAFTWNRKRKRYESAFIERNVEGHLPVVMGTTAGREGGPVPTFTIDTVVRGSRVKRTFVYEEGRVRPLTSGGEGRGGRRQSGRGKKNLLDRLLGK